MRVRDEVKGTNTDYDIRFFVGQGNGVKFEREDDVCLDDCYAYNYKSAGREKGHSCSSLHKKGVKVSKARSQDADFKLCCRPRKCQYDPGSDGFEVKQKGWGKSKDPYKPLISLAGVRHLSSKTCVCCSKPKAEVPWGTETKTLCKKAYDFAAVSTFGYKILNVVTLTVSDRIKSRNCDKYCGNYPSYPHGKFTDEWRNLAFAEREFVDSLHTAGEHESFAWPKTSLPFLAYVLNIAVFGLCLM